MLQHSGDLKVMYEGEGKLEIIALALVYNKAVGYNSDKYEYSGNKRQIEHT